jgi:uncharacterized protein (TIGR02001 family)
MMIREGNQMNGTIAKTTSLGAASLLAALLLAGPALADGLPGKGKAAAPQTYDARPCSTSASVGVTSDYVFRGVSQSNENAALQGGVDFTCGRFYAGVWASSVYASEAVAEVDLYAGFKHTTGPVNWDLGFIYYTYPGESSDSSFGFGNYVELKLGASGNVWQGGTLGGTVYYAPDYRGFLGDTVTLEATFSQTLPKVDRFSPTFSAAYGNVRLTDHDFDYNYWNVGLTVGFLEKWSLDLRYWDSSLNKYDCADLTDGGFGRCDGRFVGTLKYTF